MKDDVIDPTEILIDGEGTIHEKPEIANPWIRFFARMFDYAWFFLILKVIKTYYHPNAQPIESFIPLEYALWMPVEAFFLWAFKTTPGKWWFRTSLRQGRLDRLDYVTALHRAFRVWNRGMGFGIPIINGFCLLFAFQKLKIFKITSWDREDHIQVSHLPISRERLAVGAAFALIGLMVYYYQ